MDDPYVKLTAASNPVQRALIEEILKDEGLPFRVNDLTGWLDAIVGSQNPLAVREFLVPRERLQEAKDLLCGHGVVCDVSERLLYRSLEEIVQPLLKERRDSARPGEQDLGRLAYFVGINNKETVNALFAATLQEEGGGALLEDLFFHLAKEDSFALRILARGLRPSDASDFSTRFSAVVSSASPEVRARLLDVLPELPPGSWRSAALLAGLRDGDPAVRLTASEALFTLRHGDDGGYDPDAPEAERELAIGRLVGTL